MSREYTISSSFAFISQYVDDGNVFEVEEKRPLDFVTDPAKQIMRLCNFYIVGIKQWITLNKRNSAYMMTRYFKYLL